MYVSEVLLYGGVVLMVLSAAGSLSAIIIFRITGKHIREELEAEYGPDPRK